MKFKALKMAVACFSLAVCGLVNSSVIYDNGSPNDRSGNETTAWVQAEDFMLASGGTIESVGVYIGFTNNNTWDGAFEYFIFSDSSGIPGTSLTSGSVSASVSDTGTPWCCQGNAFLFEFNLDSAFTALAGTTYWLGIHAADDFSSDGLFWVTTAANGTSTGHESNGGTFDNWFDNNQEHAFYLSGERLVEVPSPTTAAILLIGVFALFARNLKK